MFRVWMMMLGIFLGLMFMPIAVPAAILLLAQRSREKHQAAQAAWAQMAAEAEMAALYRGAR